MLERRFRIVTVATDEGRLRFSWGTPQLSLETQSLEGTLHSLSVAKVFSFQHREDPREIVHLESRSRDRALITLATVTRLVIVHV